MIVLGDIPKRWSSLTPEKICMVCTGYGEVRLNWAAFNERINRLANSLKKLGLKKGDHVAILLENCHRYAEIYYAMAKTGIIPVPLNLRLHPNELQYIIQNSDAVGFIVGPEFKEVYGALKPSLSRVKYFISAVERIPGMEYYEDLVERGSPQEPKARIHENDTVMLMYTGGTTGMPKGAVLTHRGLMTFITGCVLSNMRNNVPRTDDDGTLFILPAFHISLWPILTFHFSGDKVVMVSKPDLKKIFEAIEKEKITHMNAVPTVYFWLVNDPDIEKYDLSSVKAFSYAGAPMPTEILKQCIKKFGNIFSQGYGATEGGPWTTLYARDHVIDGSEKEMKKLKSVGRPAMVSEIRVVDEKGHDCKPGEVGEIIVRSKSTMKEYWKDPDKTAKVKKGDWYYTGDIGSFDEDGFLYLADRASDMIKSGGEKVYPFEVEDVLYRHPAVSEAIVIGIPDLEWGEKVHAVIYLKPDHFEKYRGKERSLKSEMTDFCRQNLTHYKCPKGIDFSPDPLPKTAVGKMLRKEVREKYREIYRTSK